MQIELKNVEGLKHTLTVTIPSDEVKKTYQEQVRNITKNAKVPGFRPGKVPAQMIEKHYGDAIKADAINALIRTSIDDAIKDSKANIAGMPELTPGDFDHNADFIYTAAFEVFPEIELSDLSGVKLDKESAEVTDADVDTYVDKLRRQHAEWNEVDRAAAEGDKVVIDFEGFINKEPFDGGTAKDFELVLGDKQMIPGFEEGLLGAKTEQSLKLKVTFPKDYGVENLAGKKAVFQVTVHNVKEVVLPELTEEFIQKLLPEAKTEAALKDNVREQLEDISKNATEQKLKTKAFDALIDKNPIEVPTALIDGEIEQLQNQARQNMARQYGLDKAPEVDLPKDPYVEEATRRIKLGLLLSEFIKKNDIKVTEDKLKEKIQDMVKDYPQPEEMVDFYLKNDDIKQKVEAMIVEEVAIDGLIETAKVNEKVIDLEKHLNG